MPILPFYFVIVYDTGLTQLERILPLHLFQWLSIERLKLSLLSILHKRIGNPFKKKVWWSCVEHNNFQNAFRTPLGGSARVQWNRTSVAGIILGYTRHTKFLKYEIIYDLVENNEIYYITILYENEFKEQADYDTIYEWYSNHPDDNIPILADTNKLLHQWLKPSGIPAITLLDENMNILAYNPVQLIEKSNLTY